MRIILLGPPGAGKGTQSLFLTKTFNIPQISTGDMLRNIMQSDSSLASNIKNIINSGKFVSDEIITKLVNDRILKEDCKNGYLLDGFPRNISQANSIRNSKINIDFVIDIDLPENIIIERMSGRLIHPSSGRTYHKTLNPPKINYIDDITGESLIQREDDKIETVQNRLAIYQKETKPLLDYYILWQKEDPKHAPKYLKISGIGTVEEVNNRIFNQINNNI